MNKESKTQSTKVMTKKDVQNFLDCGRDTVDRLFQMPSFPSILIGKKKMIVMEDDLMEYLNQLKGYMDEYQE